MGAYEISAQNIDFWPFPEVKEISSIIERLSPSVCSGNENNWIGLLVLKTSKISKLIRMTYLEKK